MTIHSAKGLEFGTVFVVGMEENLFPSPMSLNNIKGLEEERRLFYVALTRAEKHCFLSYARSRFRYGKMEFSSPSRFLRDIDPQYIHTDKQSPDFSRSNYRQTNSFGRWDYVPGEEYIDRLHTASAQRYWKEEESKLKPVVPHTKIRAAGTVSRGLSSQSSERFGAQSNDPKSNGTIPTPRYKRVSSTLVSPSTGNTPSVSVGQKIQHERFGIGEVIKVEGSGDNAKATISFLHAGEKQLLLRFARFKIMEN